MAKNIIYISEAEAASDFASVLARVRAGAEIVIEGHEPVVVVRSQAETEIGLSVVTVAELVHGAYRAQTQAQPERDGWSLSSDCAGIYRSIR
jgi:hypothetical protein